MLVAASAVVAAAAIGTAAAIITVVDEKENDDQDQNPRAAIAAQEIGSTHGLEPPFAWFSSLYGGRAKWVTTKMVPVKGTSPRIIAR